MNQIDQEMDDQQLDLNAPLLSVRRLSTVSSSLEGLSSTESRTRTQQSLQVSKSGKEISKPAGIPFLWEQIPGKPKHQKKPTKFTSPGRSSGGEIPSCLPENDVEDEDVFLDAMETLSSLGSFSWNFSDDNTDLRSSRSFCSDSQTREYLMNRFLPAAKSIIDETPLKKQEPLMAESKVSSVELTPLMFGRTPIEGNNKKKSSKKISGYFVPRICAKNSLRISNMNPESKLMVRENDHAYGLKVLPDTVTRSSPLNRSGELGMPEMLSSPVMGSYRKESPRRSLVLGERARKVSPAVVEGGNAVGTPENMEDLEVCGVPPLPEKPSQSWLSSRTMMKSSSAAKMQQRHYGVEKSPATGSK